MTTIGKGMAFLLTIMSVLFVTLSLVVFYTDLPNLRPNMAELEAYKFTAPLPAAESQEWTATHRVDGKQIKTSRHLGIVLKEAYNHAGTANTLEKAQLQAENEALKMELEQYLQTVSVDQAAVAAREEELRQELAAVRAAVVEADRQGLGLAANAQAVRKDLEARRQDVSRVQNELRLISAEQRRLSDLEANLTDLIHRLEGTLGRLQNRNGQLKSQQSS